jgi:hypothetical protein
MVINSEASPALVFKKTNMDEALSGHLTITQWNRLTKPSAKIRLAAAMYSPFRLVST